MVVLGAVAAVIGLVLLLLPSGQASFGWFAYAPLSDTTFFPPGGLLSPQSQIGMVLIIVGLVLLAFGAGWFSGNAKPRASGDCPIRAARGPENFPLLRPRAQCSRLIVGSKP